jgi:ribulose-phosphate 3-epimerase
MKVIPVINCPDVSCAQKKLAVAKTFLAEGDTLHLDITDGVFATHKTWADPLAWSMLKSPFGLEVHLMVEHPEDYADDWLAAGARRLIVHVEGLTPQTMHQIFSAAAHYHAEVMLSSKPETAPEDLVPYIKFFEAFQVLAVQPGPADQEFLPFICEKIRFIKENAPDAIIEVDGGMNPETARRVKDAGADTIVSSHYLFGGGGVDIVDSKKAYEELSAI